MNAHKDTSFIFCTQLLDEIGRIQKDTKERPEDPFCPCRFLTPTTRNGSGTKIAGFNTLLAHDRCIAVTHTTFLNATEETLELIHNRRYTLFIDETFEVIREFNKMPSVENSARQFVSAADLNFLIDKKAIRVDKDGRVIWTSEEYSGDFSYSELKRFAKLDRLYYVKNSLLLVIFPPEVFKAFDRIYILTYMFDGSMMKSYFDTFGIEYEKKSVCDFDQKKTLTEYDTRFDLELRNRCKELIHICDLECLHDYKKNAMSKAWYQTSSKNGNLKKLKGNISNYFNRYLKKRVPEISSKDIMWTCMGEYEEKLKGKGYTITTPVTNQDKKDFMKSNPTATEEELKEAMQSLEEDRRCFIPCNSRATNKYKTRWALAYCVNMYYNRMYQHFFDDYNQIVNGIDKGKIVLDDDLYALSCMIQWIFRSRIRDWLPIEVYIPNKRMRGLLVDWLENKI